MREMQMKNAMRYNYTPIWVKLKKNSGIKFC